MVWLTWLFNCRRPQITNQLTDQQEELPQIKWTENECGQGREDETDVKHWLKIDKRACVSGMELKDPVPMATGQLIGIESRYLLCSLAASLSSCLFQLSVKQMNKRKWQATWGEVDAGATF